MYLQLIIKRKNPKSRGSVPPNGGHIAHDPHQALTAAEREAGRGMLIPPGELNAAAAGAGHGKHPGLGGLELSYSRTTSLRGMARAASL